MNGPHAEKWWKHIFEADQESVALPVLLAIRQHFLLEDRVGKWASTNAWLENVSRAQQEKKLGKAKGKASSEGLCEKS